MPSTDTVEDISGTCDTQHHGRPRGLEPEAMDDVRARCPSYACAPLPSTAEERAAAQKGKGSEVDGWGGDY